MNFNVKVQRTVGLVCAAFMANNACAQWLTVAADAARTGRSTEIGPRSPNVLWRTSEFDNVFTEFAETPLIVGNVVVALRTPVIDSPDDGAAIIGLDIDTGRELWRTLIPQELAAPLQYLHAFLLGSDGVYVYVARSSTGTTFASGAGAKVWKIDANTGTLSDSGILNGHFPGETGVPSADGGLFLWKAGLRGSTLDAQNGRTLVRTMSPAVSVLSFEDDAGQGTAHPASFNGRFYCWTSNPMYPVLRSSTGRSFSPGVVREAPQAAPMLGSNGVIFANCPGHMMFALQDIGNAGLLTELWRVPSGSGPFSSGAVGLDNSVYFLDPDRRVIRVDGLTGATIAISLVSFPGADFDWHIALDAEGKVYFSDGGNNPSSVLPGSITCLSPDLQSVLWQEVVDRIGRGGVAVGPRGTVVVVNRGHQISAYRDVPRCAADFNHDGVRGENDIYSFLEAWFGGDSSADIDGVPGVGIEDVFAFIFAWFEGC